MEFIHFLFLSGNENKNFVQVLSVENYVLIAIFELIIFVYELEDYR